MESTISVASTEVLIDPAMLDAIIEQLESAQTQGWNERRRSRRQSYPRAQLIAPFYRRMPTLEMFKEVTCHDISTSGVGFYWPALPDFHKAIIALGDQPRLIYLGMQVVRQVPLQDDPQRILVGCQFIDRVAIR
jgi:hypothetical protein